MTTIISFIVRIDGLCANDEYCFSLLRTECLNLPFVEGNLVLCGSPMLSLPLKHVVTYFSQDYGSNTRNFST